jgi:hypothetical protein
LPNHCSGRLTVEGPEKYLKEFQKAVGRDGNVFDIHELFPVPAELEGICEGGCTVDGKRYSFWRERDGKNIGIGEKDLVESSG